MPAQETVRASFFYAPGRQARGGGCLRGGLFMGWSVCGTVCGIVCGAVCLRDGQFAAPESFQGRGQGRNRGTGQGNRESGIGNRESGGGGPVGQWSDRSASRRPVCRPDVSGRGEWPFCVRRNIYGGFLAPCAITRYIYKSELKKQTDR